MNDSSLLILITPCKQGQKNKKRFTERVAKTPIKLVGTIVADSDTKR
jgi:hypothetical protein